MTPSMPVIYRCCPVKSARVVALPPYPLTRHLIHGSRFYSPSTPTSSRTESNRADTTEKPLPESPAKTYRKYNRLAFNMEGMHSDMRRMWLGLQTDCIRMEQSADDAIEQQLIERGTAFCDELEVHHDREEAFLFPKLAARMPEFGPQSLLVDQHKQVHGGIASLKQYLLDCHRGERGLDPVEMKKIMDSFGDTLWAHLDDEVYALRAERIRLHWTLDEFRKIP